MPHFGITALMYKIIELNPGLSLIYFFCTRQDYDCTLQMKELENIQIFRPGYYVQLFHRV